MTITAQQLADLQADAAIGTDESIFTNAELSRIWDRVSGADSENTQHEAALALVFRQLLSDANKYTDYKAGATEEKASQIWAHLKASYEMYKPALESALGESAEIAIASLKTRQDANRTNPDDNASNLPYRDSIRYPRRY